MSLPGPVRSALERELGPVRAVSPIRGGCVSEARRVELRDGHVFVKFAANPPIDFFRAEVVGLSALRAATTGLRIPGVAAEGVEEGYGWIAIEWLPVSARDHAHEERLGSGLAELHRSSAPLWGWDSDGYIGALPQSNRRSHDWTTFWWEERLAPQLALLGARGAGVQGPWDELRERMRDLLDEASSADGPSLLHGDLWSGNVVPTSDAPALVDPAVYHGHREVDLAMLDLFGGYGRRLGEAYEEVWPLTAGAEERRAVYQLYYLLVHVNLFGAAYVERTVRTLRTAVATR